MATEPPQSAPLQPAQPLSEQPLSEQPLSEQPLSEQPLSEQPLSAVAATDRLTAYHESGHAVIALILGRDVHRVSILPNKTRLGQCDLKKGMTKGAKDWLETEALILLAGVAAEGRLSGRYCWDGASRDLRQVRTLSQSRAGNPHQAERLERRWLEKVEFLLNAAESWRAVQTLADDLVQRKTISGRSARYHVDQAIAWIAKQPRA